MKAYSISGCIDPHFLTSALVGREWSASRHGRFTPRERAPGTQWIGGWVGPRTGLNNMDKRKYSTCILELIKTQTFFNFLISLS
jgi:hypothetical protein